jgi:hypothetical protein
LIAREYQKLLGVAISVIGLVLVDLPFSKKPVGFLSKPDVFSRVILGSCSQVAHFRPFICSEIIDAPIRHLSSTANRRSAVKMLAFLLIPLRL